MTGVTTNTAKYSSEAREWAIRLVYAHEAEYTSQWAVMQSLAGNIGRLAEALRKWVSQDERVRRHRPGLTTHHRQRIKYLEPETREVRRANEVLHKAAAFPPGHTGLIPRC